MSGSHFGEADYQPTDEERSMLRAALEQVEDDPDAFRTWDDVRRELRPDG